MEVFHKYIVVFPFSSQGRAPKCRRGFVVRRKFLTCADSGSSSRRAVQQSEGKVVRCVGRKRCPPSSSPDTLCDEAGLWALLVAGQRRAADVPRARAGYRHQTGPSGRGPGGGVLTVGAAGDKGLKVKRLYNKDATKDYIHNLLGRPRMKIWLKQRFRLSRCILVFPNRKVYSSTLMKSFTRQIYI